MATPSILHELSNLKQQVSFGPDPFRELHLPKEERGRNPVAFEPLNLWETAFGAASPSHIYSVLSQGLENVELKLFDNSCGEIRWYYGRGGFDGSTKMEFHPNVASGARELFIDEMDAAAGRGIAKVVFRNILALLESHYPTVTNISLNAESIGSYAWAKFGFVPTEGNWNNIKKELAARLSIVAPQLSGKVVADVQAAIESPNPKSLWAISDFKEPVAAYHPANQERAPAVLALGKFLLINNDWEAAELNLTDPPCSKRLRDYIAVR